EAHSFAGRVRYGRGGAELPCPPPHPGICHGLSAHPGPGACGAAGYPLIRVLTEVPMYLQKLIPVNWGSLESSTPFEFTEQTLIVGASGVGKSMLLDAIQTVMTAAHSRLCKYNASQTEDATRHQGRSYRSLEGFITGERAGAFM